MFKNLFNKGENAIVEEYNNKDIWYIENKYQSSRHRSYFMSNCAKCEGIKHSN